MQPQPATRLVSNSLLDRERLRARWRAAGLGVSRRRVDSSAGIQMGLALLVAAGLSAALFSDIAQSSATEPLSLATTQVPQAPRHSETHGRNCLLPSSGNDLSGCDQASAGSAPGVGNAAPAWTNLSTSGGPPSRAGAALAYDAADGETVLFGGAAKSGYLSDTWTFKSGVWKNITSTAGTPPSPRTGATLAYDAAAGYLVLLGGYGVSGNCSSQCNDLWEFSGGLWSRLPTPWSYGLTYINQLGVEATYDSSAGYVVVESLSLSGPTGATTWEYNAGNWTDLSFNATSNRTEPAANFQYATVFDDPALGGVILFGGWEHPFSNGLLVSNQTWLYTQGMWVNETANSSVLPPARFLSAGAFDPITSQGVIFGGYYLVGQSDVALGDTWTLAGLNWTNASPSVAPPPMGLSAMGWDAADNLSLLFGGGNANEVPNGDTWSWGASTVIAAASVVTTPNPVDVNSPAVFSAAIVGGTAPFTYNWSFGDGAHSALASPTHAFGASGNYSIILNLTDAVGHVTSASLVLPVSSDLTISGLPISVTADAGSGVQFSPTVAGGTTPISYSWNFGDGATSKVAQASHAYATKGVYHATFWANDSGGGSVNSSIVVVVNPALGVPTITATPSAPALGELVNFSAHESGGTTPYAYAWTFGDGGTGGSLQNISHVFTTNGPFSASVVVTDGAGVTARGNLSLSVALNLTILANWTVGAAPLSVGFQSTVEGGVPGYTYHWSFGDGRISSLAAPSHVFEGAGSYASVLTVTDGSGHSAQAVWTLFVSPGSSGPPQVSLVASPAGFASGQSTIISATVSGGFGGYVLTWGGDLAGCSPETALEMICTPSTVGVHVLSLRVEDARGESSDASVSFSSGPISGSTPAGPLAWAAAEWIYIALAGAVVVALVAAAGLRGRPGPSMKVSGNEGGLDDGKSGRSPGSQSAPPKPPSSTASPPATAGAKDQQEEDPLAGIV